MCKIRFAPFAHRNGASLTLCFAALRTSIHHEFDEMLLRIIKI